MYDQFIFGKLSDILKFKGTAFIIALSGKFLNIFTEIQMRNKIHPHSKHKLCEF